VSLLLLLLLQDVDEGCIIMFADDGCSNGGNGSSALIPNAKHSKEKARLRPPAPPPIISLFDTPVWPPWTDAELSSANSKHTAVVFGGKKKV
jgi:hypothetical protein